MKRGKRCSKCGSPNAHVRAGTIAHPCRTVRTPSLLGTLLRLILGK